MSADKSFVGKVEQNVDDLNKVRKRKPWLFYLMVIGLVVFGGLYVFEKIWGIPKLKEDISSKKDEIVELKRDRDAKANQLAPFLAVANKQFQDSTESERLKKLLQQLEEATIQMKRVSESLPQPRALTQEGIQRIKQILKDAPKQSVILHYETGDREVAEFAKQLKILFEGCGWVVTDFVWRISSTQPPPRFSIQVASSPSPAMNAAMCELFDAAGVSRIGSVDTNLAPNTVFVFVGPR